jgi:hypothetical protein
MNSYVPGRSHPFSLEGEGQDEGTDKSTPYLPGHPHPNPLPKGEGIYGTAMILY